MRLYKTTITPTSNFATPLKGDTLFGQMCWAIVFASNKDKLEALLSDYETNPFLIVSDPFAVGYLPKPTAPSIHLNEDISLKKENRKKIWLTLEQLINGQFNNAKSDKDAVNQDENETVIRNSINYKTSTTGSDGFDPYGEIEFSFSKKDIYFLIGDNFTTDDLTRTLQIVSEMGYGKDATIGKGRFRFSALEKIDLNTNSTTYMALSPFTPNDLQCKDIFYEPFTRFGKIGASRVSTNPFKKPIVLADSGAVIQFQETQNIQYLGKAIKNISTYKDVVHQGYSIVVPIKEFD